MKALATFVIALCATTAAAQQRPAIPAPDFRSVTRWINSGPLHMPELRGKVVLVDFWAFSCSNCLATLPHLKRWHAEYKDQGLVIVGVHSPEFDSEKDPRAVRTQVKRLGIEYPVAQDNDLATWQAWAVQAWPTSYLVDHAGNIVLRHVGEGHYEAMEAKIRELLERESPLQLPLPLLLPAGAGFFTLGPHRTRRGCAGKAAQRSRTGGARVRRRCRDAPSANPVADSRTRKAGCLEGAASGVGFFAYLSLPIQRK